ncbi:protocatechuate 3,4-dioxygenase subunit alpha [Pseudaestuariivita atlantica]|uniref:Protocatechuate 3,4-dioxygenase n=1 Tax=Pseudaestuariivita atlantica TaxID=1317121 RepID=A0A0L1JNN5_9RHOB|nr:protocatechuate 3,4-dioxygenase subunit alpha [Pseudaestuariivita atlantica]KNG93374.1 protocatechuate 3,4-dioxygenase [Pseudaestuariivita atlantica]
MVQNHRILKESPSQTAGPYVHIGCTPNAAGIGKPWAEDLGATMITGAAEGSRIRIVGNVIDGTDGIVRDAMVEIFQADAQGRLKSADEAADPHFTGWGRCACDLKTGVYSFDTVKPGRLPWVDGKLQAPHVTVWVVARGINIGLHTRLYFPDEEAANAEDPVLKRIEHAHRIPTLIARAEGEGTYRFDIRLQGGDETVFFDM